MDLKKQKNQRKRQKGGRSVKDEKQSRQDQIMQKKLKLLSIVSYAYAMLSGLVLVAAGIIKANIMQGIIGLLAATLSYVLMNSIVTNSALYVTTTRAATLLITALILLFVSGRIVSGF